MSASDFERAALAAGALAFCHDGAKDQISLAGPCEALGLSTAVSSLDDFIDHIAPGDRARVHQIRQGKTLDTRLRVMGPDKTVRYARLIGEMCQDGYWRGLVIPAGLHPSGGHEKLDLEAALHVGLKTGEVIAHHQPIVDLTTRALAGFEALARWDRVDGDIMDPDSFLPLAAEQGLTAELGQRVRESAARDGSAWQAANPDLKHLFIAANATAGEICAPGFADQLLQTLNDTGLKPGQFKLEVSETEVMRDPDAAEAAMKAIKAAGVSLALDDFGTGYSSLSRLDRFPFDTIKIDQYFVRAALSDPSAKAIVSNVVSIARSYAMTIVAEGVETEDSAQMCADLGCDFGQGFRFSRALRPEDAALAVRQGVENRFLPPA